MLGLLGLMGVAAAPALGEVSYDMSGFGTVGAAASDQDFVYQRHLDSNGTLNRDSVIGVQLDAKLNDAWGMTLQGKLAPSTHSDTDWEPTLTWAFIAWRPTNDWLLRLGRLRLPLLLYSANNDVGATFDFVRLPAEVYSVTPTPDVNGLSFSKTWLSESTEWTLEGYLGTAHSDWRFHLREGFPPAYPAGTIYQGLDMTLGGLVLSLRTEESSWRIGLHRAEAEANYGAVTSDYPYVALAPGVGYYKTIDQLPGPGLPKVDALITDVLTLGAEITLPYDTRLIAELARRRLNNAILGPDTTGGYVALLREIGRWTPYVYWSAIRSSGDAIDLYEAVNATRVPSYMPSASTINYAQVLGADFLGAYDQQSFALGTSFSPTATSKIKAEWLHIRTGAVSSFVDAPSGEESGGRQANVFSLSYSFMF